MDEQRETRQTNIEFKANFDRISDEWKEIDGRPIPAWYDDAKLGIFIHWGIYSVPAFAPKREEIEGSGMTYSEWYAWQINQNLEQYSSFHKKNYGSKEYNDFVYDWKAEMFKPDEWARLFKRSGAQYVALVTKHHDGFCLWNSSYTPDWNSVVLGPKRDIVGELMLEVDKVGLRRGVYYSLTEWFHPLLKDPANADYEKYALTKMLPEMKELVEKCLPQFIFTDGEWSTTADKWHSADFLNWLIHESKVADTVVYNDRWGADTRGLHGGVLTTEYGEVNSAAVGEEDAQQNLKKKKWEECRSLSHSFAFNRNENLEHYLTEKELIEMFVGIVVKGGNLCLNVGPCADGTISPIIQERLHQIGEWLDVNGEAIYKSRPFELETDYQYAAGSTQAGKSKYLFISRYSFDEICINTDLDVTRVGLLGYDKDLEFEKTGNKLRFKLPVLTPEKMPCRCVYTIKLT